MRQGKGYWGAKGGLAKGCRYTLQGIGEVVLNETEEPRDDKSWNLEDVHEDINQSSSYPVVKTTPKTLLTMHHLPQAALQASLTQAEAAAKTASTVSTREAARQADLAATRDQVKHLTNALQSGGWMGYL